MISNSSPLICLAKVNQLQLLKQFFGFVTIPLSVKEEVLVKEKQDSHIIKGAIEEGWLRVENPKEEIDFNLGKGENATISLVKEKNEQLIIDDALAVRIANSLNIRYLRTPSVIFMALQKKLINKKQALSIIDDLVEAGYYIAPKHLAMITKKLLEDGLD